MPTFIENVMTQLNLFWTDLERGKRLRLIALFFLLILFVSMLVFIINRKEYVTLYSDLHPADAGEILEQLKEMKVDAKPVGSNTILVLKQQEPGVRMQLSSQGYPKSGFNYDLFMNGVGFGTTDYEKRRYFQFQLQDRLQEAIRTLEGVSNAIVTISLPEEDSFVLRKDKKPATASVILKLDTGYQVTPRQVLSIESLVSKSILGLETQYISIIDTNMNLLNYQSETDSNLPVRQLEMENQVRERLQKQITALLEPVFGYNGVMVAVSVQLDFDKRFTETVRFEPTVDDSGLVVSMTELREKMQGGANAGVPGADSNAEIPIYPSIDGGNQSYDKVSRTVNYELDQIREQIEQAQGQLSTLSVSVLIDSEEMDGAYKQKIQDLVAGAVGVDTQHIIIENLAFASAHKLSEQLEEALKHQESRFTPDFIRNLVVMGLLFIGFLVILFMLYRMVTSVSSGVRLAAATALMDATTNLNPVEIDEIDFDEPVHTTQKQIEKLVTQRPSEVAQLLRTWLTDD